MNIQSDARTVRIFSFKFELTAEELADILEDPTDLLTQLERARNGKHGGSSTPKNERVPCPECGKLSAPSGLTLHMMRAHNIDPRKETPV